MHALSNPLLRFASRFPSHIHILSKQLLAKRFVLLALLAGMAFQTSGCAILPAAAVAGGIEGMSLNQTGKTGSDHLISLVTGEDCSVLRYTHTGTYCLTAAEVAERNATLHRPYLGTCYRVRGSVACYDQPDVTHTSETAVYHP